MTIYLPWLDEELMFPDPEIALEEPEGLLCAGGDLSPPRLLLAYRHGIFPWYEEGQPILWWSPDPRCALQPGELHISRSMRRLLRQSPFTYRFDTRFDDVVEACAAPRDGQSGTWITSDMRQAYGLLHKLGHAHSIEVYRDEALVGGLYGVALGGGFFGESMFSRCPNASKAAFIVLLRHLQYWEFGLMDAQVSNPHLYTLGCREIPRTQFLSLLALEVNRPCSPDWAIHPHCLSF